MAAEPAQRTAYARWTNGPSADPGFFPIAVWLQQPRNAPRYQAAGINTYVGLWRGPTEEQLAALSQARMKVICEQSEVGLKHLEDPVIIGWMHGDEPDNAQAIPGGKGYGPPIRPEKIQADYRQIKARDPSRPVLLNLGQGVAWDGWHGRGVRSNHPEDYPEYVKGGDIVSFDIYPVVHDHPAVKGNLGYVARGVERLVTWSGSQRIVWNCIECTPISSSTAKPTPHQVRAEVWMSLIHGSQGILYFVHQWHPRFIEAGLLEDAPMLEAVTALNRQIAQLAPVLNQPTVRQSVTTATKADVPVAVLTKKHAGALYLFAVCLRDAPTTATFTISGPPGKATVEVLDEHRQLDLDQGRFEDSFGPWDVHLYRVPMVPAQP